jgi:hypothetical protein
MIHMPHFIKIWSGIWTLFGGWSVNLVLLYYFQNIGSGLREWIKSVQLLHVQSDVIPEIFNFHQQQLWNKLTASIPLLQAFPTHSTGRLFRQNKITHSPFLLLLFFSLPNYILCTFPHFSATSSTCSCMMRQLCIPCTPWWMGGGNHSRIKVSMYFKVKYTV